MASSNGNLRPTAFSDYEGLFAGIKGFIEAGDGKQPGDTVKGVERMIDVLKGEGVAKGRDMPKRLPLGSEVVDRTKARCNELIRIVDEWEDVIKSTDLDGDRENLAARMQGLKTD